TRSGVSPTWACTSWTTSTDVGILCAAVRLYSIAVLGWVILSWIQVPATHPLARVTVFLDRIIYPVILPLRRIIPPLRLGAGALDLSPVVLLIGLSFLQRTVCGCLGRPLRGRILQPKFRKPLQGEAPSCL